MSEVGDQQVKMLMVKKGPKMWIEMRDASTNEPKQVVKMDLSAMPGGQVTNEGPLAAGTPTAGPVLGDLGRRVAFDSVRDEDLDGEPCKVFEGKERNPKAGAQPKTTRVWFSMKDGMVRRIQEVDAASQTITDMRISNIEANPPLPMSRFDYTPPAGVPVIDMTEMLKQMMEGLGKAVEQGAQEKPEAPAAPAPTPAAPEPTPAAPAPTPAAPEPTPAAPEPTPAAPAPTPAAPEPTPPAPTPAAPEPTPAAPEPTPAAPGPTPAAPTGPVN
jgi:hypothetical protein